MDLNLNKTLSAGMPAYPGTAMQADAACVNYAQTQAPETELTYSARVASESLAVLEKCVAELSHRLQPVLTQDTPSPAVGSEKAQRSISSPLAIALMAHAHQTDNVTSTIQNLLRRIVL